MRWCIIENTMSVWSGTTLDGLHYYTLTKMTVAHQINTSEATMGRNLHQIISTAFTLATKKKCYQ